MVVECTVAVLITSTITLLDPLVMGPVRKAGGGSKGALQVIV